MTAATLAVTVATAASGAGPAHPNAVVWAPIYGFEAAETSNQTMAGIVSGPAAVTVANTNVLGKLYYVLNGDAHLYSGAFNVSNGDLLAFTINNVTGSDQSGTVTVKSAAGAFTVGTFTYLVRGSTS